MPIIAPSGISSDSGSDVQGGSGLAQQIEENNLDGGTNEDLDENTAGGTAGPDVGDADLDSDTDAGGTGERATVGRDTTSPDGGDINVDHIESIPLTGERDADALRAALWKALEVPGVQPEYAEAADPLTLEPVATADSGTVLLVAARVGRTRLIDNAVLS